MKKCVSCGIENEDDAIFCAECGLRFGSAAEEDEAAHTMPETGKTGPVDTDDGVDAIQPEPPVQNQPIRMVIPPTPEPALPPPPESQSLPQPEVFDRPTQQFQTVPQQRIVYDPSQDIKSLQLLYKKKYPALGILAVVFKILGWFSLVFCPIIAGVAAAFPTLFQPYMYEEYGYAQSTSTVASGVIVGLIIGVFSLLYCYAMAAIFDFFRDKERDGRIHTDILLRMLNKK